MSVPQDEIGAIASLVISTSATFFTARILSASPSGEVPAIQTTPLDQNPANGHTFAAGRLQTWTMDITMKHDPAAVPPLGVHGQVDITFRDQAGTVKRWADGFLSAYSYSNTLEELIEATGTLTLSGHPQLNPT